MTKRIKLKKSPFEYNSDYERGYDILSGVRAKNALMNRALSEPYNTGMFSTVSTDYAPDLSYDEKYQQYPQLDENANKIELEDGEVVERNEDGTINDTPWYKAPFVAAGNVIKDSLVSPADVWRQTLYKGFEAHLGSLQSKLMKNKWEIEDLDEAQQYLDQIDLVQSLLDKVNKSKSLNNPTYTQNLTKLLQDEINKLNTIESDIRNKWRDSDSFLKIFTNFGKIDAEQNGLNSFEWAGRAIRHTRRDEAHGFIDKTKALAGDVLSSFTNTFSNLGYMIGDIVHGTDDNAATVRNIIKNSDKDDEFINQYFKGYKNADDIKAYKQNLLSMIKTLRGNYDREDKELLASQLSTINTLRNGNWAFDPRKIDPIYKAKQEANNGSLFDIINPFRLPYVIPEMGSSYSDLQTSLAMLGSEQAFAWAGELLNPGKKVKIGMTLLGMGTSLAIAKRLREEETGSEVSDAYSQRLVDKLYNDRRIDAGKVLNSIDGFAKLLGGLEFNPDELDIQKKMALALSYNFKTGDPIFDLFSKDVRKGLTKVYNENMSLSTMDYLQALPFMNYTRSVMKEMASEPLAKLTSKIGATKVGLFASKAADKYRSVTLAMTDKTITKLFGEGVERTAAKLKTLHTLQWLKGLAKKGMFTGFIEGVEEGQQQLLQDRYRSGEYDDYNSPLFESTLLNPFTLFDIPSSLRDLELGTAALGCYLGINFGDPDNGNAELRKAMTTGAVTGMLFSGLHALGLSNLQRADMNPGNLRALYRQYKNDAVLAKMVGDNYGAAQDDAHIATFFGAMDKKGLNRMLLLRSLNDFKRFKGEMVKDEYIDRDIDLLNNTFFAYNNPAMNDILKNLNVNRGTEDHLKIVQNAVRAFMDYDTLSDEINKSQESLKALLEKIDTVIKDYVGETKDEGEVPDDVKALRTLFRPILDALRKQYQQQSLEHKRGNEAKRESLQNDEEFTKGVKLKFKYDEKIKEAGDDLANIDSINKEYETELGKAIDNELKDNVSEKQYINASLHLVFEYRKLQQLKKVLDLFDTRHKISKEIEKQLGIDLNSERLASVVDNMRQNYKRIKSETEKILNKENEEIDKRNALYDKINQLIEKQNNKNKNKKGYTPRAKYGKINHVTLNSVTKDVNSLLEDMDDFNKNVKSVFINNAVRKLYEQYRDAYFTGEANPYSVRTLARELRWSELSKEQQLAYTDKVKEQWLKDGKNIDELTLKKIISLYTYEKQQEQVELEKLSNRLKLLVNEMEKKKQEDRTADEEIKFQTEISEIRKKAAQRLIELDLNKKRERQKIAHREFLRDGGLTNDDIDAALEGDEKAKLNVEESLNPTSESLPEANTENTGENETQPESLPTPQTQPAQPTSNPLSDLVKQRQEEGGLLDTTASPDELAEEEIENRSHKPKNKPKESTVEDNTADTKEETKEESKPEEKPKETTKPVEKEDIVEDSEKPGVAASAKVDTPSSEDVKNVVAGDNHSDLSYQTKQEKSPTPSTNQQEKQTTDNKIESINNTSRQILTIVDQLQNGKFDLGNIASLDEGIYNIDENYKLLVFKKDGNVMVQITSEGIPLPILLPNTHIPSEELHEGEYITSIIKAANETLHVSTNEGRIIQLEEQGVRVNQEQDASDPNIEDKNVDKNTGNEKDTSESTKETDDDIVEQSEGHTVPETSEAMPAPINTTESTNNLDDNQQLDVDDDGDVTINGNKVSSEQQLEIKNTNSILGTDNVESVDIASGLIYDENNSNISLILNSDQVKRDFLSQTFFYLNSSEKPPYLRVNGKDVKLKYKIHSGKELSKRLIEKGWFESTEKFYVVTNSFGNHLTNDVDGLTVAMIMYDHKNKESYITYMRTPYGEDLEKIKISLYNIGIDTKNYQKNLLKTALTFFAYQYDKDINELADPYVRAYSWYIGKCDLDGRVGKKANKDRMIDDFTKKAITDRARINSSNGKSRPLSVDEIYNNIEMLKERRKEIIDAYCTKDAEGNYVVPEKIRTDVKPKNPRISNGSIKSKPRKSGEAPKYHMLFGELNGLGIASDIVDIQQLLDDGSIEFGIGKGMYGNPAYGIMSLDGSVIYPGKGYAGKIYFMYKTPNGTVPIMLREARFGKVLNEKGNWVNITADNLNLAIDPSTGTFDNTATKPSAAEILLYLLTGKLNEKYYPNQDKTIGSVFCDLFINNGVKTTQTTKNTTRVLNKLSYYAKKQLSWDIDENTGKATLTIVLPNENGILQQRHITGDQLFANTEESIAIRKQVVLAIADNMHFNTDLELLTEKMNDTIIKTLRTYFENNPDVNKFSFADNALLSFNKEDLFNKDGSVKNVSVLAWMIATGKLLSDIDSNPLVDPFVFATGVEQVKSKKAVKEVETKTEGKDTNGKLLPSGMASVNSSKKIDSKKRESFPKDKVSHVSKLFRRLGKRVQNGLLFAIDEADKLELSEKYRDDKHGKLVDRLLIDLSDNALKNTSLVKNEIEQKIKEYESSTGFKSSEIEYDARFNNLNPKLLQSNVVYILTYEDGNTWVTLKPLTVIDQVVRSNGNTKTSDIAVTGVFSDTKGDGKFNETRARKWLADTLGISSSRVIVLNGILRSLHGKEVYGVMRLSTDTLNQPIFMLSNEAGEGVEYHEAWHYVNLLLHDEKSRDIIYKAYCEKHPEYKNRTYREVEEALAEEYRRYAITLNGKDLVNTIKRWFNNVYDFCTLNYRNRDLIRNIFNNINTGKYKNQLLDKQSLAEFKRRYSGEVNQSKYHVPTVDDKTIDKLKYIDSYLMFYRIAESLANMMIDYYAIDRIEKIKSIDKDSFKNFLYSLKRSASRDVAGYVDDVFNNPDAFYSIVQLAFMQYGLLIKIKKLKQLKQSENNKQIERDPEEETSLKIDTGDRADNTWDVFQFGVSKKDNVANRAKLFLTHILRARLEVDPKNPNNKILQYEFDDLLLAPVYLSFGEAWTKITSEMWSIESYGAKDKNGNFLSTSLRGMVKNRAKNEWFYRVLDAKLDELDGDTELGIEPDLEMQNQIYNTVKSQMAQMAQIWLEDDRRKFTINSEVDDLLDDFDYMSNNATNEDIDDVSRNWNLINDNGLRAKRSLPRQWSNSVMLSGLISLRGRKTVVSEDFVDIISNKYNTLTKEVEKKAISDEEYQQLYSNVSDLLADLLSYMCIPCDADMIDYIVDKNIKSSNIGNAVERFKALKSFIKNKKDSGSISDIIESLKKSKNKETITVGKSGSKELSKLYMGYKTSSQICLIAEAYNSIHPSSLDFAVKGPDGSMHYPISLNNHMSDAVRQLNIDKLTIIEKMKSPYAAHSLIFNIAKDLDPNAGRENQFVLNAFIGIKDTRSQKGLDYFGITNIEDFIAKMLMTFNNKLTLPTMADKKTWYAIEQKLLTLPHDLISYDVSTEDGSIKQRRFSNNTLDIFAGYFIDELNSVKLYYNRENIAYLNKHRNNLRDNFHGKFKYNKIIGEDRMTFGGNGGLFRYLYDADLSHGCNLNQYLEALYNRLLLIEENTLLHDGVSQLQEGNEPLDGFELVRRAISEIESKFKDREVLRTAMNDILMKRVDNQISLLTKNTSYKLGFTDINGRFFADAIPSGILNYYAKEFTKNGVNCYKNAYSDNSMLPNLSLSAIANHTAATMISIIELEKVFSGDPAFYKWKYQKSKQKVRIFDKNNTFFSDVSILKEKDSDKIKRLGALLSPGSNIRTDYGNDITKNAKYKILTGDKYSVLNMNDFLLKSRYFDEAKLNFARQSTIEFLRLGIKNKKANWLYDYLKKYKYNTPEDLFAKMYQDYTIYEHFMDENNHDKDNLANVIRFRECIDEIATASASPYELINVSDALVIIRPELYRKIRIGLGQWTEEDEEAYQIIEKDGSWMNDIEKAKKVTKLELFPLKMSYFQNDSVILSQGSDFENRINLPVYNKMAIFPMFKYMTRSKVGRALYDRMNKENNTIDMLVFESAVKVGDNQNRFTPNKDVDKDPTEGFNFKDLAMDSDKHLDENNQVVSTNKKNSLAINIQSLNGLRMQLNTESHEAESRGIGTLMFKIAFSNILDDADYCIGKVDKDNNARKLRKGRHIKHDIMSCINALTLKGALRVEEEFGFKNGVVDRKKSENYVRRITRSNGLGYPAQDIVDNYGIAASLTSRLVFEQGVSSLVNGEVVKINTKGGAAVLQSIFGLTGFDRKHIKGNPGGFYDETGYHLLNDGNELKWIAKNNTMEVMLSINFFRAILPSNLRDASFNVRRQWLIDHDILYGTKSSSYDKFSEKDEKLNKINKALKHRVEYEVNIQDNVLKLTDAARTFLDNAYEKDYDIKDGLLYKYEDLINNDWSKYEGYTEDIYKEIDRLLTWNYLDKNSKYKEVKPIKTQSNPMPIGIGYRIPTLGMSSMFGFICADVLPETSGDLIIVPREFTSQTGSDFDVDKLFIAMKSYTNGVYDDLTEDQKQKIIDIYNDKSIKNKAKAIANLLVNVSDGAILNRLLDDYLDIITDIRNFDNARASIDTITSKIKKELLPLLQTQSTEYRESGYELTPVYQLRRKMEFTTGKDGIGPFALNITNMALTQFTKLTMKYTDSVKPFKFGELYAITGQDGLRIADWLSAMVNAHVDVAKDPYIFDMNINSATYKFVNFLLRAGKGLSTFTYIAQSSIKDLADSILNANGMYGNNIKRRNTVKRKGRVLSREEQAWIDAYTKYAELLKAKLNLKDFSEFSSKEEAEKYIDLATQLYKNTALSKVKSDLFDINKEFEKIFDLNYAKLMLKEKNSIKALVHQLLCLHAYNRISPYANEMSDLVKVSRIDTEKFGNNIADQLNFKNTFNNFKYGKHIVRWYIAEDEKEKTNKELDEFEKQHGHTYALRKYFGATFLDSKLHLATELTLSILRNLLCTATDVFEDLFTGFFKLINGTTELQAEIPTKTGGFETISELGYVNVTNSDIIKSVSQAIDNIMRYRILRNAIGVKRNEKALKYSGIIDFTCGNNPETVTNVIKRLLFGDPNGTTGYEQRNIFENVSILIDVLEHHEQYEGKSVDDIIENSGLVDFDGNIVNEFLKYLRPLTASDKFPIGRMLLAKSSFGITGLEESILVSAFDDLLQNKVEYIRKIARDLVFYAYYSSYDTNGVNSFFKFVPAYYRQQYDKSLKHALYQNKTDLYDIIKNVTQENPEGDISQSVLSEFTDTICRNYWYDDNIVPVCNVISNNVLNDLNKGANTILLHQQQISYKEFGSNVSRINNVPGAVITNTKGTSPFIKILRGTQYYLYKNIGTILRKSGKSIKVYLTYVIVGKRGVHQGGIHQYEFNLSQNDKSIFSDNLLPDTLSLNGINNKKGILQSINEYIQSLSSAVKPDDEGKPSIEYTFVPDERTYSSFRGYYPTRSVEVKDVLYSNNGDVRFQYVTKEQLILNIFDKCDILINLDSISNESINKQIQYVQSIVDKLDTNAENKSYTIAITGRVLDIEISDSAIDNYSKEMILNYKEDLLKEDPNMNELLLEAKLKTYKDNLNREDIKYILSQARINDRINTMLDTISGIIPILAVYSDGERGVGEAAIKYAQKNATTIEGGTPAYVVINKKNKSTRMSLLNFINKFNITDDLYTLSDEQYETLKTTSDVIDTVADVIQQEAEEQLKQEILIESKLNIDVTDEVDTNVDTELKSDSNNKSDDETEDASVQSGIGFLNGLVGNSTPNITQEASKKENNDADDKYSNGC